MIKVILCFKAGTNELVQKDQYQKMVVRAYKEGPGSRHQPCGLLTFSSLFTQNFVYNPEAPFLFTWESEGKQKQLIPVTLAGLLFFFELLLKISAKVGQDPNSNYSNVECRERLEIFHCPMKAMLAVIKNYGFLNEENLEQFQEGVGTYEDLADDDDDDTSGNIDKGRKEGMEVTTSSTVAKYNGMVLGDNGGKIIDEMADDGLVHQDDNDHEKNAGLNQLQIALNKLQSDQKEDRAKIAKLEADRTEDRAKIAELELRLTNMAYQK